MNRNKKNSTFEVGMELYGKDKEYERFANIYEIIIKEIKDDKVTYDQKSMCPDLSGHCELDVVNHKFLIDKSILLMYNECEQKVWKDKTTTLSQMQTGTFNNIELYGPYDIPPDFDLINGLINQN